MLNSYYWIKDLAKDQKSLYGLLIICLQAYAPGPYGDYIAPPPHATQIVYSSDGQPYAVAYPYQYQGTSNVTFEQKKFIFKQAINVSKFEYNHC